MRVADVVVDALARAGTRRLFAAGESVDAFLEAAPRASLDVVATSGGGSATVMAAVTGILSDAPGVALLDDLTGLRPVLAHTAVDQAPVVALTGGRDARASLPGLENLVKASLEVTHSSAGHWIAHAARLAMTSPRGPVHLHVPAETADMATVPVATACRPSPPGAPSPEALDAAAECLARFTRPVVVAGVECRAPGVAPWLRAFAESLPAPVLVTPAAKGVLPDPHPLLLGQLVRDGDAPSVLARADLIVALGLDPAELAAPEPGETPWLCLGPRQAVNGSSRVEGDVALILEELAPRLRDRPRADWDVALLDRLKRASLASVSAGAPWSTDNPAGRVIELVRRWTPGGTIATAEWGLAAEALRAWACVGTSELLLPAVPALRPFAVAAATAAQLARPDSHVVGFARVGDLADVELETVRRLGLPVVVIVTAGGDPEGTRSCAESLGATVAGDERELQTVLDRALSRRRPAVIDACGLGVVRP